MRKAFLGLCLAFFIAGSAPAMAAAEQDYIALVRHIQSGEAFSTLGRAGKADSALGLKLRKLYSRTRWYKPYDITHYRELKKAIALVNRKQLDRAVHIAQRVLDSDFTNMRAHFVLSRALKLRGDKGGSQFHSRMYFTLLYSIMAGRNGRSPKSAFWVIGIREEVEVLRFLGLRKRGQKMVRTNRGSFDKIAVLDPRSGRRYALYFNMTTALTAMSRRMRRGQERGSGRGSSRGRNHEQFQ